MKTEALRVYGIVQGVGFRPTVSRHALRIGVHGSVSNMGPYVEILAQGPEDKIEAFFEAVVKEPPVRAVILKTDREEISCEDSRYREYEAFSIIESEKQEGEIFVSPDIATCDTCRQELFDPSNRRYLHPFINCTCCGPRLTILDGMPYDRVRTSMAVFPMCRPCHEEYVDPASRRYDAQPVCCNDCGPQLYLIGRGERGTKALHVARQMIADGKIIAIKGIGGFHLCCDAANEEAVALLRRRKKRPVKPFAVMMRDLDTVRRECLVSEEAMEMLTGHQKPIILLERNPADRISGQEGAAQERRLCPSVAPGNPKVGVMLPYAPVQMLLFDYPGDPVQVSDCLVMTSANTSGAPICRDDEDAIRELSGLCDAVLSHDRLIRIRADDSVMDYFRGKPYMVRRSRGFAPLPFMVEKAAGGRFQGSVSVLAAGGELKNSFCISKKDLFYVSPYIGDMEDVRTVRAHRESVKRMEELLEASPELVVCDLHPGYHSSESAQEMADRLESEKGRASFPRLLKVQHHYAHILSCMAENDYDGKVIGVSFDGTGYGEDGTIWGGEILSADYDDYERKASIQPFAQAGGDLSAKEGWRIAVSLLRDAFGECCEEYGFASLAEMASSLGLCDQMNAGVQLKMIELGVNCVTSTSAGRLFDSISALLGICTASTFEGDASMRLEFAAERYEKEHAKEAALIWRYLQDCAAAEHDNTAADSDPGSTEAEHDHTEADKHAAAEMQKIFCIDFIPEILKPAAEGESDILRCRTTWLFAWITKAYLKGAGKEALSYLFHAALAVMAGMTCIRIREDTGIRTAALSGGVYQNQLLLRLSTEFLEQADFQVLIHSLLPPNDGGICLGQAVYGARYLARLTQ